MPRTIHTIPLTATRPMSGDRWTMIALVACPPDRPSYTIETVAVSNN